MDYAYPWTVTWIVSPLCTFGSQKTSPCFGCKTIWFRNHYDCSLWRVGRYWFWKCLVFLCKKRITGIFSRSFAAEAVLTEHDVHWCRQQNYYGKKCFLLSHCPSVLIASLTIFLLRSVNSDVHGTAKYFAIMVLIMENALLKRKPISVTKYMHWLPWKVTLLHLKSHQSPQMTAKGYEIWWTIVQKICVNDTRKIQTNGTAGAIRLTLSLSTNFPGNIKIPVE